MTTGRNRNEKNRDCNRGQLRYRTGYRPALCHGGSYRAGSGAAVPQLRASRGVIINIASDWGLRGGRKAAAYCASKGGLVLLTKAMALDFAADGIRVNAICPGDVDTPMLEQEAAVDGMSHPEALAVYGSQSPTGRVSTVDEVAALTLFLASAEAAQITGAAIPIDGGNTA